MTLNKEITSVPLLDLQRQYESLKDELTQAVQQVMQHQQFIMGPEHDALETQLQEYTGAPHALGCASGSDALLLALMGLNIGQGDYVITSPFTFFATAGAIARVGATPIFLDIKPEDYNLDPAQVEAYLAGDHPLRKRIDPPNDKIKALLPVHLYGQMADMPRLMQLAEEHDLAVIEDAAQAVGSRCIDKAAGTWGDVGCFSCFPSKNLGAYGDAGFVTATDDALAHKIAILRKHGAEPKYHHSLVGINSRLDTMQAAVLGVKLSYLDDWSDQRRAAALRYNQLFEEAGLALDEVPSCQPECTAMSGTTCGMAQHPDKLILPQETTGAPEQGGRHVYHQYVIRTHRRDELAAALKSANIGHSIYYPVSLHEQECFADLGYQAADCPAAHCASQQTLALPMFPELTEAEQAYVVDTISRFLKS
jgi:dTDP-4-amino-4,6-dideoxygalactose transaminase